MRAGQTPTPARPPPLPVPSPARTPRAGARAALIDFFHAAVGGGRALGGAGEALGEAFRSQRRGSFGGQAGSKRHRSQSLQAEGGRETVHDAAYLSTPTPLPAKAPQAGRVEGNEPRAAPQTAPTCPGAAARLRHARPSPGAAASPRPTPPPRAAASGATPGTGAGPQGGQQHRRGRGGGAGRAPGTELPPAGQAGAGSGAWPGAQGCSARQGRAEQRSPRRRRALTQPHEGSAVGEWGPQTADNEATVPGQARPDGGAHRAGTRVQGRGLGRTTARRGRAVGRLRGLRCPTRTPQRRWGPGRSH